MENHLWRWVGAAGQNFTNRFAGGGIIGYWRILTFKRFSMTSNPLNAGPTPPAILRACARYLRLDTAGVIALTDEVMASNPDFMSYPIALAHFGISGQKVEAVLRLALYLELCHREQKGNPLPLFAPEVVDRHRKHAMQTFRRISDIQNLQPSRAVELLLLDKPQLHVTAWMFKLLKDAGVIPMLDDDDRKLVICAFTLLSLYSSTCPPRPEAG